MLVTVEGYAGSKRSKRVGMLRRVRCRRAGGGMAMAAMEAGATAMTAVVTSEIKATHPAREAQVELPI